MKFRNIYKLALLIVLSFAVNTTFAKVIKAASVSYLDVNSAVNKAVVGDIVQIPAGTNDWGLNTLDVIGGIYLRGAGKDETIIKRGGSTVNFLIKFDGSNSKPCTLSDLTLQGYYGGDLIYSKGVGLWNGCVNFKVFNCKFKGFADCALCVGNSLAQRGVIYKNDFIDNYYEAIHNLGYAVVVYGNGTWPALELGSENAVFVEDNYFSGNRHNIASNNGSRYVFRYNEVVGTELVKDYAMTDAHGLSSWSKGSRSYEIYNNKYTANLDSGHQRTAIGIRGGDGVIFNNSCTDKIEITVELWSEGFKCGEYPGADQIRALYIWDNEAHDRLDMTFGGISNNCPTSIVENRDYFRYPPKGYKSYKYPHPLRIKLKGSNFYK